MYLKILSVKWQAFCLSLNAAYKPLVKHLLWRQAYICSHKAPWNKQNVLTHCPLADAWKSLKKRISIYHFHKHSLHIFCKIALGCLSGNGLVPSGNKPLWSQCWLRSMSPYMDGLMQERHYSIADALELCLSCTNPLIWCHQAKS